MALTAADLQKRHEIEGAPDPFSSQEESSPTSPPTDDSSPKELDTSSQLAFPSLATSVPRANVPAKSTWGSPAGPRIKADISKQNLVTDSFTLSAIDLSTSGKDGKPATLGEVMKQVMAKFKVKIEASANRRTGQTTFHVKAESQKELEKSKRSLFALLSPVTSLIINAPASTIATIIGPRGSTLKQIRDQTNVKIDIPRRESLSIPNGNGRASSQASSGNVTPLHGDEEEEIMVPITVTGPQPLVYEAQAFLNQIISSKTSKTTQRVRDIPLHILPFVVARRDVFQAAAQGVEVSLSLNAQEREITVGGDREAVSRVVETIKTMIEGLESILKSVKIPLRKCQHRLLMGKAVEEIMAKSKCSVVVPKPEDPSDEVTIWGNGSDLPMGLGEVMQKANSQHIHEFPLPGPISFSKQILLYMARTGFIKTIMAAHPVSIFIPPQASVENANVINIDIVGEKSSVDAVVSHISEVIGKLVGATKEVTIDWLIHRVIISKYAKKLKQLHEAHHVQVIFPSEAVEQSYVLLVYDPMSPPGEKERHLEEVSKELLKIAKDAADVKSQIISVDKKWHDAVVGKGGTTLNAIIGEDNALSIKVGADAGQSSVDVILIRGTHSEVDRAVKEILKIVENAQNDEIVNSYSVEFDVEKEYVGRIVGAQGAGINKLREQLGVRVDVRDDIEEKEKEPSGKKRKVVHQKSRIKITGRKENVEEAKKRILTQIERLADETSEVLKIPAQYHSSLIGQSGKYAIRLEEKYSVKITFPRQSSESGESKTREQLKPDEVLVKGGKKGVAGAKSELLDVVEFEKESNNVLKFTVPTRSVPRILGKGGASINEIKNNTDAQVDVDKSSEELTQITVRGTKQAITAAKAAILAISDQVTEEITVSLTIESKFHRALIGAGGQGLRDVVTRCGGPSDPKLQAGLIRFPRQGESSDEVRLRGEPKLVHKLKDELEKNVSVLRDRVVLAVEIPANQHRALIGRGGQHLNDLQNRIGVQVQFPGSRSFHQVGEPENASQFKDTSPSNLVKISGPRKGCEMAIEELKAHSRPTAPEGVTTTISVPLKYHHAISQQGHFFRTLRSLGVNVEQSAQPQKSAIPPQPAQQSERRIDDAGDGVSSLDIQWQTLPNYQDAEEGDSQWVLKARDDAGLEQAQKLLHDAIEHAEKMSHVGFLTLPDRAVFPRIVGTKGANVARLRHETGADITVSRENNTIVIIGAESAIHSARDAILEIGSSGTGRRSR